MEYNGKFSIKFEFMLTGSLASINKTLIIRTIERVH